MKSQGITKADRKAQLISSLKQILIAIMKTQLSVKNKVLARNTFVIPVVT